MPGPAVGTRPVALLGGLGAHPQRGADGRPGRPCRPSCSHHRRDGRLGLGPAPTTGLQASQRDPDAHGPLPEAVKVP